MAQEILKDTIDWWWRNWNQLMKSQQSHQIQNFDFLVNFGFQGSSVNKSQESQQKSKLKISKHLEKFKCFYT